MNIKNSKLIYSDLLHFLSKKERCVFTTITTTQGSTPQKPGSSAIFNSTKILAGTIGGGVTERQIEKISTEKIKSKKSGYLHFDLNNEITDQDAAICGGEMCVLIDAEPEKNILVFEAVNHSFSNRIPGVLITVCTDKSPDLCNLTRHWLTEKNKHIISDGIDSVVFNVAIELLDERNQNYKELKFTKAGEEKLAFLELIVPLPQLFIAGAGHLGKALSHIGKLLDFEVIVWDERPEFANAENLSDADKIFTGSIEDYLNQYIPKKDTYIVIATHDHKNDADVLRKFINSEVGYIGMIGSRKKIARICESFLINEWATKKLWEKIHSPIGINIGSKTVQEIAISIAAQLIQARDQNRKT